MFFNYKEFSDWYAAKFQRNNPLPWQDGMNAMLYYLTKSVPDNTRVFITVSNNPTGVTISGKGIESDPYMWTFNFNKSEIEGPQGPQGPQGEQGPQGPQGEPGAGLDDIVSLDITPTFAVGGVAVDQTAGRENIAVDVKYGIDGEIPQIEGVLTLPFKAGDGIIIDVDEDNKRIVFKATGGAGSQNVFIQNISQYVNTGGSLVDLPIPAEIPDGLYIFEYVLLDGSTQYGNVNILLCKGDAMTPSGVQSWRGDNVFARQLITISGNQITLNSGQRFFLTANADPVDGTADITVAKFEKITQETWTGRKFKVFGTNPVENGYIKYTKLQ